MSKVFILVSVTLDGYLAPAGPGLTDTAGPGFKDWMAQWSELHKWVFPQKFFRENLKFGEGGETGDDNRLLEETFRRTGASIMGKRMFDAGEHSWPEEAPFHTPVFVLTHQVRAPWERPGGTTFYFVNDGPAAALERAQAVAGGKDIRIAGGANTIVQFLNAGLADELHLAVSPVFFGQGIRLFESIDPGKVSLEIRDSRASSRVTHLKYALSKPRSAG